MSDRIEAEILDVLGEEVEAAVDTPLVVIEGPKGDPGAPGKDGHSPVVTAAKSGKTTTISVDGAAIATVEDGADGAPGKDGADGSNGKDGKDGAPGAKGADGITPTIGANGHWYLGATDTGKPSRGVAGADGTPGIYYGTTQPTGDTHPVWIDPDGDHDDGGLLPAVTAADNGKVLRVDNGAWAPADMAGGAEYWEKIADIDLRSDTSKYVLADFGVWRKAKVIMKRPQYISGLQKNVWVRVVKKGEYTGYNCGYLNTSYGYVYWEFAAEVDDIFISSTTLENNNPNNSNAIESSYTLTPLDGAPSEYEFILSFNDTSVIQEGDRVTVIGVKR